MSEIMKARQRLLLRKSGPIEHQKDKNSQFDFEQNQHLFNVNFNLHASQTLPHANSRKKFRIQNIHHNDRLNQEQSPSRRRLINNLSPQFAKTERIGVFSSSLFNWFGQREREREILLQKNSQSSRLSSANKNRRFTTSQQFRVMQQSEDRYQNSYNPNKVSGTDFYKFNRKDQISQRENKQSQRIKDRDPYHTPANKLQLSFTQKQGSSLYNDSPPYFPLTRRRVHQQQGLSLIICPAMSRICHSPVKPVECSKIHIQTRVQVQRSKNHAYYDNMFPPRLSMLFSRRIFYQQTGLAFERLSVIYQRVQSLDILRLCQPTDLTPGKYTSPAVYSALAILSQDPLKVATIFSNQRANDSGIYYLQLCKQGIWRYIVIDDFMPVKVMQKTTLLFLNSSDTHREDAPTQVWPCLLQKAIAKLYGNYEDLLNASDWGIKDVFRLITGFPVSEYAIDKDFRSYLIIIDAALKKKHIVVLQKVVPQLSQTAILQNINPAHSFQILQVKKDYLTIRNHAEDSLVAKLSFEQVLLFSKLLIFRSQTSLNDRNYTYKSYTLRHKREHYSCLRFKLQQASKCYWDVWESNPANFKKHLLRKQLEIYRTAPFQIKIYNFCDLEHKEKQGDNFDSGGSLDDCDYHSTQSGKEIQLKQGQYLLKVHLCQNVERDFTVSYYGSTDKIELSRVRTKQVWDDRRLGLCHCLQHRGNG